MSTIPTTAAEPIHDDSIDALDRLHAAATPIPWQYLRNNSWGGRSALGTADGHPIAFVGDPDADGVDEDAYMVTSLVNAWPRVSARLKQHSADALDQAWLAGHRNCQCDRPGGTPCTNPYRADDLAIDWEAHA